ncbi:hypothetical protein [Chitinophaga eiseniae]|uniref:DUF4468 domain-containing protein n=1 Tax=Chitinophaga eiseniae TaxID=634771 RepID=A0A847SY34_9BACT|nr:hypothetical protein [Chitinophaga eiseniae]NLR82762.1 hypothetical protein [Chitinophaga eiseniae]
MKPLLSIWILLLCGIAGRSFAQTKTPVDTVVKPPVQLKTVHIVQYNFFKDSLAFREEYAKSLTFRRLKWHEVYQGFSVNINNLYRVTQFKNNKKKIALKHMLLNKEQEMFVSRVYTSSLVNKVTHLDGDSLQLFMQHYQPDYAFIKNASDYDLYLAIKKEYEAFMKTRDSIPVQP